MTEKVGSPERLSNRRLVYETLVTALRRVSAGMSDGHYVHGHTDEGRYFKVGDYFSIEHVDAAQAGPFERAEAREAVLDRRRPIIAIDGEATNDGVIVSYGLAYPEDLRTGGAIELPVRGILPADWPTNEPFIYKLTAGGQTVGYTYEMIDEPFLEPDLAAIYEAVARGL